MKKLIAIGMILLVLAAGCRTAQTDAPAPAPTEPPAAEQPTAAPASTPGPEAEATEPPLHPSTWSWASNKVQVKICLLLEALPDFLPVLNTLLSVFERYVRRNHGLLCLRVHMSVIPSTSLWVCSSFLHSHPAPGAMSHLNWSLAPLVKIHSLSRFCISITLRASIY